MIKELQLTDDETWAKRCQYWAAPIPEKNRGGAAPRRVHQPLVLTGHGLGLRVDQGTLLVKDGFTHYPQSQAIHRFFPRDRRMPSRIIIVEGNGNITLDALTWLAEQDVPLVRVNWQGHVTTVIGNSAGPDYKLVRAQIAAQEDKRVALRIANSLISEKLKNSIDTLHTLFSLDRVEKAITAHRASLDELRCSPPRTIQGLLGIEGRSALAYFNAWQNL